MDSILTYQDPIPSLRQLQPPAARPRRITFTVAGGAFIDSFVGMWTNTTPAQRLRLCQYVLDAAAMQPACGSAAWTVQTVKNRLKNRAHHMLNAAT